MRNITIVVEMRATKSIMQLKKSPLKKYKFKKLKDFIINLLVYW